LKYRVTEKMPTNAEGHRAGDIIECDPEIAALLLAKGYIAPLDVTEVMPDKQLRHYNHKA